MKRDKGKEDRLVSFASCVRRNEQGRECKAGTSKEKERMQLYSSPCDDACSFIAFLSLFTIPRFKQVPSSPGKEMTAAHALADSYYIGNWLLRENEIKGATESQWRRCHFFFASYSSRVAEPIGSVNSEALFTVLTIALLLK
jgi:hypothetical protein